MRVQARPAGARTRKSGGCFGNRYCSTMWAQLAPKKIVAPNYDYEFQHAWKNEVWHLYEPVSLDLVDGGSIVEKANRWVGRAMSLNDSPEQFKIHLLLGEPDDPRLRGPFEKAENILRKMPGRHELVRESEAEQFAEGLESEMRDRRRESPSARKYT